LDPPFFAFPLASIFFNVEADKCVSDVLIASLSPMTGLTYPMLFLYLGGPIHCCPSPSQRSFQLNYHSIIRIAVPSGRPEEVVALQLALA
jgi:hypothetical protein